MILFFLTPMPEFTQLTLEHYQDLLLGVSNDSTVTVAAETFLKTVKA